MIPSLADLVEAAANTAITLASVRHSGPGPGDWAIVGEGPPITHRVRGKKGNPDRFVAVKSLRATLVDRSRYPGHVFRASTHNAHGEVRR